MNAETLIAKVWNFCHMLRDDGVSYGDYLEQITYLIFLKMADEYLQSPYSRDVGIPADYDWNSLKRRKGAELEGHYIELLRALGQRKGMLGQIFTKAQNKIQDPAKLARLIEMIDAETWVMLDAELKGDLYEGLLERNAQDTKSGAGQYFTPRPLIRGPGLRHRRLFPGRLRLHQRPPHGDHDRGGKAGTEASDLLRQRNCRQYPTPVPDESVPSQYRRYRR
jgi:type I restriction enzyme M protein